jgi:putative redox protein
MADGPKVTVRQVDAYASRGSVREHSEILIDRPVEKGGTDRGPMGGELMLIGLAGCFMSNLLAAARERGEQISGVEVAVSAQLDGTPPRWVEVDFRVRADEVAPDVLSKLVKIAERGCIATTTLKAGSQLNIHIESPVDAPR